MLQDNLQQKECEYYKNVKSRYGADIAILIKLRFAEIHRAVFDGLDNRENKKTELVPLQELTSLFLEKLVRMLKKDRSLINIFVEDADIKYWFSDLIIDGSSSNSN